LNGVTNAVNEPRKFVLAAMDFLPNARHLPSEPAIRTNS
jgi:hypothetical protein